MMKSYLLSLLWCLCAGPVLSAELPEYDLSGYKSLYDGQGLSAWNWDAGHEGHWVANGEVLHYDGASKAKDKNLWTKESYKDFTLVFDWRWVDFEGEKKLQRPLLDPLTGGTKLDESGKPIKLEVIELDSGVYLRGNSRSQVNLWNWPCGSGEVYGYRTWRKLSQVQRAALVPKMKADRPLGEWNRMRITLRGDLLTVDLNGQRVIDNAQLPGVPASGPIALQHHGSKIEFKQVMIRSFD